MKRQTGFIIPQLIVFVTIAVMMTAYWGKRAFDHSVSQARDERARLVGTRLAWVNDAAKTYTTSFFTQIQKGEAVTRLGYTVPASRVLAPTLADLNGLGFLRSEAAHPIRYGPQTININVQLTVDTSTGCTAPNCQVDFVVSTTTPLLDAGNNAQVDVRRITIAANTASPSNAGIALPASVGGHPDMFVSKDGNPVGPNSSGVAGLVAVINGYDSQGFAEFLRRDGSLPMTGNLNLQDTMGVKHDINHVGHIDAVNVDATGNVSGKFIQVNGIITEGQPCPSNGLVGRDSVGLILSCQSGVWNRTGGHSGLSRVGQNALSFNADANYPSLIITISSKFSPIDGPHTANATYNVFVDGAWVGQIANNINVYKGGNRGHYWGYESVATSQRQFFTPIRRGSNISILLAAGYCLMGSDIRADLVS